jgi:glycosyltransferase involved in cell wall biosynthesis
MKMDETYDSVISQTYLLVLFAPMVMRTKSNELCVSKAWAKDLVEHSKYIPHLTFLTYESANVAPPDAVLVSDVRFSSVTFELLPQPRNFIDALRRLPTTLKMLYRKIGDSEIIHSAVAGWPIPEAWLITPILFFRKRFHLLIIESSFWRAPRGASLTIKEKFRVSVFERLNRACIEAANLSIFTHENYKQSLLKIHLDRGHVIPASWINSEDVIGADELRALCARKIARLDKPIKLVFVGRLSEQKGVLLLIDAVANLLKNNVAVELDIFGEGPLWDSCQQKIHASSFLSAVRMRGTITYGAAFFQAIRDYDLMVIPSLSDEQPRNVFDAFSQGLPVLCSDTTGLTASVEDEQTGFHFAVGNRAGLECAIVTTTQNRQRLIDMAGQCVNKANTLTHFIMHQRRLVLLQSALQQA